MHFILFLVIRFLMLLYAVYSFLSLVSLILLLFHDSPWKYIIEIQYRNILNLNWIWTYLNAQMFTWDLSSSSFFLWGSEYDDIYFHLLLLIWDIALPSEACLVRFQYQVKTYSSLWFLMEKYDDVFAVSVLPKLPVAVGWVGLSCIIWTVCVFVYVC